MQIKDLVLYSAYAELRRDISASYLGVLWWIIEPIIYMGAFYLIFSLGVRTGGENFVSFLLCGLVSWKWFASTLIPAANSVLAYRGLIQQVYIPKFIFPLIPICVNLVKFLLVLILFVVYLLCVGSEPAFSWIYVFPIVIVQLTLILGCSLLLASVIPYVKDLSALVSHAMMMMMFLSGIFFDVGEFDPGIREIFYLNPMVTIIESFRVVLLDGIAPNWVHLGWVALLSVLLCGCGYALFRVLDRQYPKVLS